MKKGSPEYRRATIAMLLAGLGIFNALYATQALLPTLAEAFDASPSTTALTVSAATGGLALCVVPASILSEKYGRGRVLIVSALVATGIGLLLPLAQSMEQLVLLRALQGIAIAGTPAVAMTWLSEELDAKDLPGAMGLYIAGNTIGGLTGRLIPTGLLAVTSWRWALAASSVTALALAIATAILLPAQRNFTPKPKLRPGNEFRAMVRHARNPRILALCATAFIGMGVFVSLYNYLGFRAIDYFGLPPSLVGLAFLLYLSGTWSASRAGALVSKYGRGHVVIGGASLMVVGLILAAIPNLVALLAGLLVFTASFFAMHSTASAWVGIIAERDRAEASSMYVFWYYMGSSMVGAASGWVYELLPWAGFTMVLACLVVVLVLITAAVARNTRR
ncbi:MFS transporter [Corynebacterium pseudogenitalium]|nr:MFS transporter [Corynebacterium pseudogenitalium]